MPLRDSIIRVKGRANDVTRRLIEEPGSRLIGLKRAGETKRFAVVFEFPSGYRAIYDGYRQQLSVEYATSDSDFRDLAAQMSFWAYGVPYGVDNRMDVYTVDPERRDVVPPTTDNPVWKFYLTRVPQERFSLGA